MSDDKKTPNTTSENKASKAQDNTIKNSEINPIETHSPESKSSEIKKSATNEINQKKSKKTNDIKTESLKNENLFNQKPAPKLDAPKTKSKSSYVTVFIILLVLIALIGVGWSAYQQWLMKKDWQTFEANLNEKLNQQATMSTQSNQTVKIVEQSANQNQTLIQQQTQLIQQLRQSLTATQSRIKELSGRRNQDWMLAEAEYLIKLAEFKITLENDKRSAIGLLKTADEKIMSIGDNSLIELREAIAQDIADLQLIIPVDVSGIAVQLDALSKQVPTLSIIALEFEPLAKEAKQETESEDFSWTKLYQDFLNDFVVITEHGEPIKPLMSEKQRVAINANIQLAIQQAQIALFEGEQTIYELNLDNAINWVEKYFKLDESALALQNQLKQLRQINIVTDLPKKLLAKKTIEQINQERLYQWLESSTNVKNNISTEIQ